MSEAGWSNVTALPGMAPDEMQQLQKGGKTIPIFHTAQVKNEYESKLQGRPVYQEEIRIRKITSGDPSNQPVCKVRDSHKEEFPLEWANWERTRENKQIGFPLDHWTAINDTQKAEFAALKIFTVEQFAALPDSVGQKIMGFNDLRNKANIFVNAGKDAELIGTIRAEANAKEAKYMAEIAELRALIEGKTAPAEKATK